MRSTTCNICKRPLKNPASIEIGMGPVCAAQNGEDQEGDGPEIPLAVLTAPRVFDVVLSRNHLGAVTNVPRSVIHHSPDGFEFGYGGSGPADLALNIMNAYIPPGTDGLPPVDCFKGQCSATAWRLHQEFKREFIEGRPRDGATLSSDGILSWLVDAGARPSSMKSKGR